MGCPSVLNLSGNSLENACRGMTLPPVPVSTLHRRVASRCFPMSAGNSTVAKASVMVLSSHKGWVLQGTATSPTWFRAVAIPVPTSFRTAATLTSS